LRSVFVEFEILDSFGVSLDFGDWFSDVVAVFVDVLPVPFSDLTRLFGSDDVLIHGSKNAPGTHLHFLAQLPTGDGSVVFANSFVDNEHLVESGHLSILGATEHVTVGTVVDASGGGLEFEGSRVFTGGNIPKFDCLIGGSGGGFSGVPFDVDGPDRGSMLAGVFVGGISVTETSESFTI